MIAIGCDHAATEYKKEIKALLEKRNEEILDCGTQDGESCDYPVCAEKVALAVAGGKCEKGILICGTGIGMSIAANKVRGVRCALCADVFSAQATRLHNDANVLAVGQRSMGIGSVLKIVETFLDTPFSGEERHARRVGLISEMEKKYFK